MYWTNSLNVSIFYNNIIYKWGGLNSKTQIQACFFHQQCIQEKEWGKVPTHLALSKPWAAGLTEAPESWGPRSGAWVGLRPCTFHETRGKTGWENIPNISKRTTSLPSDINSPIPPSPNALLARDQKFLFYLTVSLKATNKLPANLRTVKRPSAPAKGQGHARLPRARW